MAIELDTHSNFGPHQILAFFDNRGWNGRLIKASSEELVAVDNGAAVECIDGRYGRIVRKMNGPKVPGAGLGVALSKRGGDLNALSLTADDLKAVGFNIGTHSSCGFAQEEKGLRSLNYHLDLEGCGEDMEELFARVAKELGGKHFILTGEHAEKRLVMNPFLGTTLVPAEDRFAGDPWLLVGLGINPRRALLIYAETVEALTNNNPPKVEILTK